MAARVAICLVLALTLTALVLVESRVTPPKCPPPGSETIFFPDPTSCNHYYQCSNGWPNRMQCPPNLHWDDARKVCNQPSEANCKVEVTQPPTQSPTQATTEAPVNPTTTESAN